MIRLAIETLKPKISTLPFIERFGGLSQMVTADFEGTGKAFEKKSFPVSCDMSASECYEQGKYKNLVPNEMYKSVSYFEHFTSVNNSESKHGQGIWEANTSVRFVCWLNMRKLGIDDCKGTSLLELAVLNALVGVHDIDVDGVKGRLTIRTAKIIPHDYRQIFGKYSYSNKDAVFFHPYEFFAIDFDVKIEINRNCLVDVTFGAPIECLTNW